MHHCSTNHSAAPGTGRPSPPSVAPTDGRTAFGTVSSLSVPAIRPPRQSPSALSPPPLSLQATRPARPSPGRSERNRRDGAGPQCPPPPPDPPAGATVIARNTSSDPHRRDGGSGWYPLSPPLPRPPSTAAVPLPPLPGARGRHAPSLRRWSPRPGPSSLPPPCGLLFVRPSALRPLHPLGPPGQHRRLGFLL